MGIQAILTSVAAILLLEDTLGLLLQLLFAACLCALSVWLRTGDPRSRVVTLAVESAAVVLGILAFLTSQQYLLGTLLAAYALFLILRAPAGTFIAQPSTQRDAT